MSKVEELQRVVASLTAEEYREFRQWFLEQDWELWDRQIKEDSRAGRLDFLVREIREAREVGEQGTVEER
jgi:succinate dehydrogenase flavin-adding protein (antitoxin of CptAB toxin-antitoxin module)